jgi:hypothetical protein
MECLTVSKLIPFSVLCGGTEPRTDGAVVGW